MPSSYLSVMKTIVMRLSMPRVSPPHSHRRNDALLSLLANQSVSILAKIHALENATKRLNTMRHIVQIERGITENMNEGLIVLTPDLRIAEMNSAAEIILATPAKKSFWKTSKWCSSAMKTLPRTINLPNKASAPSLAQT